MVEAQRYPCLRSGTKPWKPWKPTQPKHWRPTESPVLDMPPKKKKSFIGTPDLVPWLPPGKTKEETFNSFAHKKNSGVYDLSASAQANDKIWSTSNSKKFSTESSPWSIRWNKE